MFKSLDWFLSKYNLGYSVLISIFYISRYFDIGKNFELYYCIIYYNSTNIDYNWLLSY